MIRHHTRIDATLDQLRRELAVLPSPNFENRVRVAALTSKTNCIRRARRFVARQVSSRTLIAFAAVVAAAVMTNLRFIDPVSVIPTVKAPGEAGPAPTTDTGRTDTPVVSRAAAREAPKGQSAAQAVVIVPPDQLIALTKLLETMRQKQMAWTPGPPVPGVAEPLADVEPIEIPPIKVEPLPALLPAPGERKQP